MFTSQQLTSLHIRHLIIHDVPNSRINPGEGPTLSQTECELDARRIRHLRDRLVGAIGSRSAYDIIFAADTRSPVPDSVRDFTHRFNLDHFVQASQQIANYLYESQFGTISSGLLAIMDAVVGQRNAAVILKIERQEGLQLQQMNRNGLQTIGLEVLENLVLTEGTRLFKAALFHRTGAGPDDFEGAACDSQKSVITADDVAKFWLRFLGCELSERPRVRTARFFERVVDFINDVVTDPVQKNDLYEHLVSELKSQPRNLSPRRFMEEKVPAPLRVPFRQYFEEANIPMTQFPKDLEDISRRLRRRAFTTTRGVTISVPEDQEDQENLIEIGEENIIVNDTLDHVGKK